jgi:hypothetical protein
LVALLEALTLDPSSLLEAKVVHPSRVQVVVDVVDNANVTVRTDEFLGEMQRRALLPLHEQGNAFDAPALLAVAVLLQARYIGTVGSPGGAASLMPNSVLAILARVAATGTLSTGAPLAVFPTGEEHFHVVSELWPTAMTSQDLVLKAAHSSGVSNVARLFPAVLTTVSQLGERVAWAAASPGRRFAGTGMSPWNDAWVCGYLNALLFKDRAHKFRDFGEVGFALGAKLMPEDPEPAGATLGLKRPPLGLAIRQVERELDTSRSSTLWHPLGPIRVPSVHAGWGRLLACLVDCLKGPEREAVAHFAREGLQVARSDASHDGGGSSSSPFVWMVQSLVACWILKNAQALGPLEACSWERFLPPLLRPATPLRDVPPLVFDEELGVITFGVVTSPEEDEDSTSGDLEWANLLPTLELELQKASAADTTTTGSLTKDVYSFARDMVPLPTVDAPQPRNSRCGGRERRRCPR